MHAITHKKSSGSTPANRRALFPVLIIAGAALLTGCAAMKRDHVTVGSVPEDYRTNHPITIAEREAVYDVAVPVDATGLSLAQNQAIRGFIANYERSAGSQVKVMVPSGSPNSAGAQRLTGDIVNLLTRSGVPAGRIMTFSYQAGADSPSAPIRISYLRLTASTDKCGRWGEDMADTTENRHWKNFGCSYQTNLAAQVANPADLLGPRPAGEIDGTRRATTIESYEAGKSSWSENINY